MLVNIKCRSMSCDVSSSTLNPFDLLVNLRNIDAVSMLQSKDTSIQSRCVWQYILVFYLVLFTIFCIGQYGTKRKR